MTKGSAVSTRILAAVALLAPRPGERLLEIGCGTGQAIETALLAQPSATVVAIDRSAVAVERARRVNLTAIAEGRASIEVGDIEDGPVEPGGFDRAFCIRVNAFWTKPAGRALPNLMASLRPGGEAWIIYDGPAEKTDVPILRAMREAGMSDIRTVRAQGAAALVAVVPMSD